MTLLLVIYNRCVQQITDAHRSLDSIDRLRSLYSSGYRSAAIDRSIAKLLGIERFAIERQLADLQSHLTAYETQFGMLSADFYSQFKSGKLGDDVDYFEWAVYYEMCNSALSHLALLDQTLTQ